MSLTVAVALSQSAAVLWVQRWRQCLTHEGGVGVGHLYAEELGSTRLHTHMRVCMCM